MIMISLCVLVQTTKYKNGRQHVWFLQPARPAAAKLVGSVHARREKRSIGFCLLTLGCTFIISTFGEYYTAEKAGETYC